MPAPDTMAITLQQLMDRMESEPSLSPAQRSELCSAIRRFARLCGKHPSEIIADPAVIRNWIGKISWQMAGLSKAGWANLTSRLTRAMKIAGVKVHRRRRNFKLLPEWEALLAPLNRRDRDELHRFAGWCSVHGIDPMEVDADVFERFRVHLETETIHRNPRERWHVARRGWNSAIAGQEGSGFPSIPNNEPEGWRGLPWSAFPGTLLAEVEAYKIAVTTVVPFSGNDRRAIKEVTLTGYLNNLRWYLSRLVQDGEPASHFPSLAACVDPAMVKRGLSLRLGNKELDDRTKPALSTMMTAIISVARFVGVTDEHYKELKRLFDIVGHRPEGMCERNVERLTQFDDERARRAFANLPFRVAERLSEVTDPTVRQAQEMQMAALLAILLHLPLRIKNAAALDLDMHLRRPTGGKAGCWHVHFDPGEVKNGVVIDGIFNEHVSALLERYVGVFRPALLNGNTSRLFIGQNGRAKGSHSLGRQFSGFVRREIGLVVNPHLVRHWAAFAYLAANPGDYESVRQFLGHKDIATTIRHYAGADTKSALARYDGVISAHIEHKPLKLKKLVKTPPLDMEAKALEGLALEDTL